MIDPQYYQWNRSMACRGDGILAGADITQEYLLPWWWSHYIRHNSHPVTWIDFGLSTGMKEWCRERGELLSLRICSEWFMAPQEEHSIEIRSYPRTESPGQRRPMQENPYRNKDSHLWKTRNVLFKKPFAMLQSPYKRTIWLDCDCEVRGNIKELFDCCNSHEVAMRLDVARYPFVHYFGRESCYNAGVIVYQWGCSLFEWWAKLSIEKNKNYYTDDQLLSDIISEQNFSVYNLPDAFHRMYEAGEKEEGAIIFHWSGMSGKRKIQYRMYMDNLKDLTS